MLLVMASKKRKRPPAPAPKPWGPTWAKVLAGIALAPAFLSFVVGVGFFIQGFGDGALAAVGLIVGPVLMMLAFIIALPVVLFLARQGKPLFIITMCTTGLLLALLIFYGF